MTQLLVPVTNPMAEFQMQAILDSMWPKDVARPTKIDVIRDTWTYVPWNSTLLGPLVLLEMGTPIARLAIEHLDNQGIRSGWHSFEGDWDAYTEDNEAKRAIGNALYEIFIFAIAADSRGIRIN
jgi:hypothetical protein